MTDILGVSTLKGFIQGECTNPEEFRKGVKTGNSLELLWQHFLVNGVWRAFDRLSEPKATITTNQKVEKCVEASK